MKYITYMDSKEWLRRSLVKDTDTEQEASLGVGVPAGPPDIRQMDWEGIMREMNNALANAGLFTWLDVQQSQVGLTVATNVLKRALIALYRQEESEQSRQ
jgi:hypothetical protein